MVFMKVLVRMSKVIHKTLKGAKFSEFLGWVKCVSKCLSRLIIKLSHKIPKLLLPVFRIGSPT